MLISIGKISPLRHALLLIAIASVLGEAARTGAETTTPVKPTTSTTTTTTTTIVTTTTTAGTQPPTTTSTASSSTASSTTSTKSSEVHMGCNLSKASDLEKSLLVRVDAMKGQSYEWEDGDHKYYFTVCGRSANGTDASEAFVQVNKVNGNRFVLGRLNDVDLEGATGVIRMMYKGGDKYARACGGTARMTVIYLLCNSTIKTPVFTMVEENNERDTPFCDYIFQLITPSVCETSSPTTTTPLLTTSTGSSSSAPSGGKSAKLGVFPIILIVCSSLLAVYFVMGSAYMRVVRRARGWEQIPNWPVWSAVGSQTADAFNYIIRCGKRPSEVHSYENINDRLSDDENLLNM